MWLCLFLLHKGGVSFWARHVGLDCWDDIVNHDIINHELHIPLPIHRDWHKYLGALGFLFAGVLSDLRVHDWADPDFPIEPHPFEESFLGWAKAAGNVTFVM
ncbi:unnamed protein product [Choristocarpus tenellus]